MSTEATKLTGRQRKKLRGFAHSLKPLVVVGKAGLSEAVFEEIDKGLSDHELIKVRFVGQSERKKELSSEITERTQSACAGIVGHVAIFFRSHPDDEKRKIRV